MLRKWRFALITRPARQGGHVWPLHQYGRIRKPFPQILSSRPESDLGRLLLLYCHVALWQSDSASALSAWVPRQSPNRRERNTNPPKSQTAARCLIGGLAIKTSPSSCPPCYLALVLRCTLQQSGVAGPPDGLDWLRPSRLETDADAAYGCIKAPRESASLTVQRGSNSGRAREISRRFVRTCG